MKSVILITGLLMSTQAVAKSLEFFGSFQAIRGEAIETRTVMDALFAEARRNGWVISELAPREHVTYMRMKLQIGQTIPELLVKYGGCAIIDDKCEKLYKWVSENPPLNSTNVQESIMLPVRITEFVFGMKTGNELQEQSNAQGKVITVSRRLSNFLKKYDYDRSKPEHLGLLHNTFSSPGCPQDGVTVCPRTQVLIVD